MAASASEGESRGRTDVAGNRSRVDWKLLGFVPRHHYAPNVEEAQKFAEKLAAKKRRRERWTLFTLRAIRFAVAILALIVGVILLVFAVRGSPVAADFTRVGGRSRVDTAIEASHFWFDGPKFVVKTGSHQSEEVMRTAALCAVIHDAPLLLTPSAGATRVDALIKQWHLSPKKDVATIDPANGEVCPVVDSDRARTISMLKVQNDNSFIDAPTRESAGIESSDELSRLVVFAAARAPFDAPDVAVALALAAHLAHREDVSLVVIPRYLQANGPLEGSLRRQKKVVEDGIVLGENGVLPEDTRTLLRQLLTTSDKRGLFGELRSSLDSVEPLIAALIALLGLEAASQAADSVARARFDRPPRPIDPSNDPSTSDERGTYPVVSPFRTTGTSEGPAPAKPLPDSIADHHVVVILHDDEEVEGQATAIVDVGGTAFLQLDGPKATRRQRPGVGSNPPAAPDPDLDHVLVPVASIRLIEVPKKAPAGEVPSGKPSSGPRI